MSSPTRSRPFRPHCCYCLATDVELVADRNSITGAVTLWCEDVCLQAVLAMEMELRTVLLDEARVDDEYCGAYRRADTHLPTAPWEARPEMWPIGAALDELRLVERRIHQLHEEIGR